jgi:hypothetical protein
MAGTLLNYSNSRDLLITTNNSDCIFFGIYKNAKYILGSFYLNRLITNFLDSLRDQLLAHNNRVTSPGQNCFFSKKCHFPQSKYFVRQKNIWLLFDLSAGRLSADGCLHVTRKK